MRHSGNHTETSQLCTSVRSCDHEIDQSRLSQTSCSHNSVHAFDPLSITSFNNLRCRTAMATALTGNTVIENTHKRPPSKGIHQTSSDLDSDCCSLSSDEEKLPGVACLDTSYESGCHMDVTYERLPENASHDCINSHFETTPSSSAVFEVKNAPIGQPKCESDQLDNNSNDDLSHSSSRPYNRFARGKIANVENRSRKSDYESTLSEDVAPVCNQNDGKKFVIGADTIGYIFIMLAIVLDLSAHIMSFVLQLFAIIFILLLVAISLDLWIDNGD